MVSIQIEYTGDLHCKLTHGPSGMQIQTDAPKDNGGRGEAFSPTDLVAAGLGACMLTIMGLVAKRHNVNIQGAKAEVIKEMVNEPVRRIGKLPVRITLPASIPQKDRPMFEKAALTCPVHKSLLPDVETSLQIVYR